MESTEIENIIEEYSEEIATTFEIPFPTDAFADKIFGGFKNEIFYDYLKLFTIILFIVFCIKIFAIFFEK